MDRSRSLVRVLAWACVALAVPGRSAIAPESEPPQSPDRPALANQVWEITETTWSPPRTRFEDGER